MTSVDDGVAAIRPSVDGETEVIDEAPWGTAEERLPWLGGPEILDDVREFIGRFVAFPTPGCLAAVTLWVAHTHLVMVGESSPRLALLSPEAGSGKTRTLEILELLVHNPMLSLSASPAAIFRSLKLNPRTILFDEVDAIFGKRGSDDSSENLRAMLNAGHRRGATIPRCKGDTYEVVEYPVYAPAALAGLGDLPDTLMSRSVIVRMRRRLESESVVPFRRRLYAPEGHLLREQVAEWCGQVSEEVADAWPDMPDGVKDRPADVWEPLLAVADAAGGHWPATSRAACVELVKVGQTREASLGVHLLTDVRAVFGESSVMSTDSILASLTALEESPWADLRGKALDARGLANRLKQFGISSTKVKIGGRALRGYRREHLWETFDRYLPPLLESTELEEPTEPPRSEDTCGRAFSSPDGAPEPVSDPGIRPKVPEDPEVPLPGGSGPHSGCSECGAPPPHRGSFGLIACSHQIAAGFDGSAVATDQRPKIEELAAMTCAVCGGMLASAARWETTSWQSGKYCSCPLDASPDR